MAKFTCPIALNNAENAIGDLARLKDILHHLLASDSVGCSWLSYGKLAEFKMILFLLLRHHLKVCMYKTKWNVAMPACVAVCLGR